MHEMRRGEMTALREVPFGRYYGGVDTTPLFVMWPEPMTNAPATRMVENLADLQPRSNGSGATGSKRDRCLRL